jgi:pimeloyl-ACP methyl ester carboxylesterase
LILEPDRPNGTALVYGHPTVEPADLCAPSLNSLHPTLRRLVEAGVTVALVDYPGVGTSGREPYMVASALGRSLLDVADYVRRTYRAQSLWIGGFSEGGRAALGASSLWQEYRPDLPVAGFVAGAPWVDVYRSVAASAAGDPADGSLVDFMVGLLKTGDPAYVRAIAGLAESYSVEPDSLLDREVLAWLDRVESTECQRPESPPKVHMSSAQATRFSELVDRESRFAAEPDGRVWLISGAADVFFDRESAQRFVLAVCSRSTLELRLRSVPGGHGPAAGAFGQSLESLVAGDAAGAAGFVDPCGAPSTPSA